MAVPWRSDSEVTAADHSDSQPIHRIIYENWKQVIEI